MQVFRRHLVGGHTKGAGRGDGQQRERPLLFHIADIRFRLFGLADKRLDDLLVIVGDLHRFGQTPAQFPAAAAELAADGDDPIPIHKNLPLACRKSATPFYSSANTP